MVGVKILLEQARKFGLKLRSESERLIIRGPRTADTLARKLLARKAEVLAVLTSTTLQTNGRVDETSVDETSCGAVSPSNQKAKGDKRGLAEGSFVDNTEKSDDGEEEVEWSA